MVSNETSGTPSGEGVLSVHARAYLGLHPSELIGQPKEGVVRPLVDSCIQRLADGDDSLSSLEIVSAGCAAIDAGHRAGGVSSTHRKVAPERNDALESFVTKAGSFFSRLIDEGTTSAIQLGAGFYRAGLLKEMLDFRYGQSLEELQATASTFHNRLLSSLRMASWTIKELHDSETPIPSPLYRAQTELFVSGLLWERGDLMVLPALNRQAFRKFTPFSAQNRFASCWDFSVWRMPRTEEEARRFFLASMPKVKVRVETEDIGLHFADVITPLFIKNDLRIPAYEQRQLAEALVRKQRGQSLAPDKPAFTQSASLTPVFAEPGTTPAITSPPLDLEVASGARLDEIVERARRNVVRWLPPR